MQSYIKMTGMRENNLKNLNLQIPKNKITIFTGVSGSGKSSIVFDTIAQEAGRQLNETFPNFVRTFLPKHSQPDADSIENLSTAIVVDQKRLGGNSRSTLGTLTDINSLLRLLFSRFGKPYIGYANHFSFNDPAGMCMECEGIGKTVTLNISAAIDMDKSINEGAILLPGFSVGSWQWKFYANYGNLDNDKKIRDYSADELKRLLYTKPEKITVSMMGGEMNSSYEGLVEGFIRSNVKTGREKSEANQKKMEKFSEVCICPACHGKRYSETTLSSKILDCSIYDMTQMQLDELINKLSYFEEPAAKPIVKAISERLQNLIDIGLDYMNLNRESSTLSGGESQRVKMVKHLSSSLTGVLYIFDEPSIGLHPRDVHRLNEILIKLRDKGNTVIVVEHDPDVIKIADHIVDMGPKAGSQGGRIVYEGSYADLLKADTLTGRFMGRSLNIKENPRQSTEFYETKKSSLHNLKNISLRLPKGIFTVITGVAGSGKSTLVNEVFAKEYPSIRIDQSAVSANSRSNPATFTGVMDYIRQCFSAENNVSAGLFSYNSDGGCDNCKGSGTVEINLSFMDIIETVCEECEGKRFKKEVLRYKYHGRNIVDIMEMTIAEAADFFDSKEIRNKLRSIIEVGLNYMTLGQPLNTLSGGECQRLKLAKELNKKGNIYILDEPTTGLHMSDITNILSIINKLADKGNSVIVIEHNLDIIRNADWVIDLGPGGGIRGGEILFEGVAKDLLSCEKSETARYLI